MPEFVKLRQTSCTSFPEALIEQILQRADEYLEQIVTINLQSISSISKTLETEEEVAKMIYQRQPKYLQEIVMAVKAYKEGAAKDGVPIPEELDFRALEDCFKKKYFKYWSIVESVLESSNIELHNTILDKYFGFRIVKKPGKIYAVRFTNASRPINV